jgi:hypothetical protein
LCLSALWPRTIGKSSTKHGHFQDVGCEVSCLLRWRVANIDILSRPAAVVGAIVRQHKVSGSEVRGADVRVPDDITIRR